MKLILKALKEIHAIRSGLLTLLTIRSIFSALSPFVNIYMSAMIINNIAEKRTFNEIIILEVITISANLFVSLISMLLNRIISIRQFEYNSKYEMRMNHKVMSIDYSDVEDAKTHIHRQKIDEIRSMNNAGLPRVFDTLPTLVQNTFTVIFSGALTFSLFTSSSPLATVILIAGILVNVFISMFTTSAQTKKMYTIMNGIIPFNRIFSYYIANYISAYHAGKDIRIYNQSELIKSESMALFDDVYITLNKLSRNQIKYSMLVTLTTSILSMIIYLFVGLQALAGAFAVGYIVQYIGSINSFTSGFTGIMTQITSLRSNNEALKVYFDFMEISSLMSSGNLMPKNDEYEIEFHNVSFKYPGTDVYALNDLNFKLNTGRKTAIVGMNGSGKTTMIKLLCRLYDPIDGVITLNGVDIKEYDYIKYINLFGVVFQDFKLFAFELGQNIAAGIDYDNACAETVLKDANFTERLKNMPKGLKTCLYKDFEEDGVEISGGEAQKIALARALYKNAPFIILDEPTSALDPIAEYEVYSNFNNIVKNKTAVYISHRLSSCRFCDDIMVFDNGELVQRGGHEELLAIENGKYAELWNAQAQYYKK